MDFSNVDLSNLYIAVDYYVERNKVVINANESGWGYLLELIKDLAQSGTPPGSHDHINRATGILEGNVLSLILQKQSEAICRPKAAGSEDTDFSNLYIAVNYDHIAVDYDVERNEVVINANESGWRYLGGLVEDLAQSDALPGKHYHLDHIDIAAGELKGNVWRLIIQKL